jgi:DNA-binding response OmpR family regulator
LLDPEAPLEERILVVDDDSTRVQTLVKLFRGAGYSALGLTDPRKVGEVIHSSRFDLIVLDLDMPEMDGFQVMAELAELIDPEEYLPILVLPGECDVESRNRAVAAGAADFLREPFDAAEAHARVRNLLKTRKLTQRVASLRRRPGGESQ